MHLTRTALVSTLLVLTGCATAPGPSALPESTESRPSNDILWVRDAAEYQALLVQTYRLAAAQLETLTRDLEPESWVVILDADETVISNLAYSIERSAVGERWNEETWREWVLRKQATAIPGVTGFLETVRASGGRIAIVTNRRDEVCAATRENLEALEIPFDHLRCKRPGEDRKESRWEEVRTGTGTGLGPLRIVMWIGDNIRDFPELGQSIKRWGDDAFSQFGVRYFVLPNPLYGSWEEAE